MALIWITKANYVEDFKANYVEDFKANYVEDFKVELTFNDGLSATVDLKDHLVGEIFEPLKNVDFFKQFKLDSWTLTWPNDSDFSPEFLYELAMNKKRKTFQPI